jgi:hypothetical protein
MKKFPIWFALGVLLAGMATQSTAQTTRVEQTHSSITYTGNWQTIAHPHVSGGTIAVSKEPGARASIAFNGTGIAWIAYACPCAGIARMYLDGVLVNVERDNYAAVQEPQDLMRQFSNLANGPHVLTIEVTGRRNSNANDSYIGIDAFDIGPQDPVRPTVTLTEPADGAVVTGMVTFSAEASDNTGVSKVAFYADNHFLGEDRIAPYSIEVDTSRAPHAESYLVRAVAYDAINTGQDTATVTVFQNGNTDVTPPFIEMSAPANGALVTGVVTLSAEGYDNVGITRVEFLTQNGAVIGTATTAPWSITRDTSNLPTGSTYYIRARAYDAAGLSFTSTSARAVTVQHEDPVRPSVSLTAPASGATLSGTVPLTADASDNVGVRYVEFMSGYLRAGIDSIAPYAGLFDTLTLRDGATALTAKATDVNRNEATSALVPFNVDNRAALPGMTRVDDAASALAYAGTWETYTTVSNPFGNTPRFHWGSGHLSRQVGATVTFAFEGVGVRLLAAKCYSCGNPTITIDGGAPQQINLGNDFLLSEGISAVVWESPPLSAGSHTVQLTVQTNAYGGSDVLIDGFEVLKVNDTAAPMIALTSPVGGDVLSGTALFEATASDDTGVVKVLFYAESSLIGEDTTAPYSITWDTRSQPFETLYLKAVAYDSIGRRTESATVRVNVRN